MLGEVFLLEDLFITTFVASESDDGFGFFFFNLDDFFLEVVDTEPVDLRLAGELFLLETVGDIV